MAAPLARRNLTHDRTRLAVTLAGIVFAIVLITVQLGLFIGFTKTTSGVIDHAGVDLWITAPGAPNFDAAPPIPERKIHGVRSVPGVASAEPLIVQFTRWRRPDGQGETVEIVGFDVDQPMGRPWAVVAGRIEDLKLPDTIMVDELYLGKLGVERLGQTVEINERRARVVGFTRGIRSFTTSPYVFTSLANARRYAQNLRDSETIYVVARVAPGADVDEVKQRLIARVTDVDVLTTAEFAFRTQYYWMFTTGAGMAVLLAAVLGLVVGVVIVAQTIYATTMDRIREYGTLKAMGASNGFVTRVILTQAGLSGTVGYALGMAVSLVPVTLSEYGQAAIRLPWPLAAFMLVLTLAMCAAASLTSIRKALSVDPATVFRS